MTFISEQKQRAFFKSFCSIVRLKLYPDFAKPPSTDEEIKLTMKPYIDAGMPGAIGSIDGVHVRLWRVAYNLKWNNVGKEGYPSRVFLVSCSNTTEIYSCTKSQDGNNSDHDVAVVDPFLKSFQDGGRYSDIEWQYYDKTMKKCTAKGLWLLTDSGFPKFKFLMGTDKIAILEEEIRFSKMVESLRKNVERCFGSLKARFQILRFGLSEKYYKDVDDVFFTCCALHNYILHQRGFSTKKELLEEEVQIVQRLYHPLPSDRVPKTTINKRQSKVDPEFSFRRGILIKHFNLMFFKKKVVWTKYKKIQCGDCEEENY